MPERKPYEPPHLERLLVRTTGKHRFYEVKSSPAFEEACDVQALLAEFGSPLFLVSEAALRTQYRTFCDTFTTGGVHTRVAYSYKTNYLPAICSILHSEGAWAEVVSGMEYRLARALGTPPEEIVFNGPYKSREELEQALGEGALVNIDGFDELAVVTRVAATLGRPARVGIRVHFRHGDAPWTKFGFNDENGDAQRALERIAATPTLRLEALHNHSGTFVVDPNTYAQAAGVLLHFVRRARRLGLRPTVLDFGGGFPSGNRLKPHFDGRGGRPLEGQLLAPFAEAILPRVRRAKDLFEGPPTVIFEPGRALVDSAARLVCTVVALKETPNKELAVVVDAGVNILSTAYWYDHDVEVAPTARDGASVNLRPVKIYGPLCMQIDVLRERALLPPLKIGAPLLFSHVGAYCMTQSMQFIRPRPAVVLLGPEGPSLIRRRENWRDVFALDRVPKRLRRSGHTL